MRFRLDLRPMPPSPPVVLDDEQRRVVDHRSGPLLVLAGPGTGKTTTIVEAIGARMSDPVDPLPADAILALTFGRRAAGELRDRVTARLGGGLVPAVATFHSFAYSLLRGAERSPDDDAPPRLMSGAEEDVRIRELLLGAVADGTVQWPPDLMGALPTLGLANEVRSVLARARDLGLEGEDLRRIGEESGRPAWAAIGEFARQEQEVMLLENVIDYAELLLRAWLLARDPRVAERLHRRYRAVFVDEYQDTDPLQVALLKALVGPACSIVAVGDPDQAIYAFRGADVGGLLRFPRDFPAADGSPAPIAVLRQARRFGPGIRSAAAAVFGSRLPHGLPADRVRDHRSPVCAERSPEDDVVTVTTYDDESALAAHVAQQVRQAHIDRAEPWSELAVLVRTSRQIPVLQRALATAGVPVVVASDEIPLRSEPAVAALLGVLHLAVSPATGTPAEVLDVLGGPMVGLTPSDLRRLGRDLRREHKEAGYSVPPSDVLIRDLVLGVPRPAPSEEPHVAAVGRLRVLLAEVHRQVADGASPEEALWTVWTGGSVPHGWPQRLRAAALAGSRSAAHDLDAVIALFDSAERLAGRYPGFLGVRTFLDSLAAQEIPAEPVADRGTSGESVRILTAHRAKGLEWDEVWVVGVQEGVWPDLRARGSTLRAEELTSEGIGDGPRPADLLEEERRLFYVACTRPRRRLAVAAVREAGDAGDQPSRFLADLVSGTREGAHPVASVHCSGRPGFPLSLDGLVAELRSVAQDAQASSTLREAAVARLAMLAAQRDDDGVPVVPLADPARWWGVLPLTAGVRPVRDPDQPIALSGSGLDGLVACPRKWFLEHEVRAETPRGTATAFGSVVHAIADFVAKEEIPADLESMDAEVDRVWKELRFEAGWQSVAERREARAALARFLAYHERADRELVDTETRVGIVTTVPTPTGTETVRLTGFVDRVERDAEGRLVPIDLKNMKSQVPPKEIPEHGQLGVYQLILREGGLTSDTPGAREEVGGAALVQLRVPAGKGSADPKVQFQEALGTEEPTWVEVRLGTAAHAVRAEDFPATAGQACRWCAYQQSCPAQDAGEQVAP